MKKILTVVLAIIMLASLLTGCGVVSKQSADVEKEIPELETASQLGAVAVKGYVYARMLTDQMVAADIKSADKTELKALVTEGAAAWAAVEAVCTKMAEYADRAQVPGADTSLCARLPDIDMGDILFPFATAAYAAEDEMTKWANDINSMYDNMTDKNLKTRDRFKQLAQQLGTDAKEAAKQFKMANEILSNTYTAEGDYYRAWESAAMATKTACKVGLFVGGIIASGGTIGAAGVTLMGGETALGTAAIVGGFVTGGTECIIDVANTGSNIFLGEHNVVTKVMQKSADIVAPVSTVFNIANLGGATAGEVISLVGENLVSWYQEGKVGGVTISNSGGSYLPAKDTKLSPEYYIDVSGMTEAQAVSAIEAAGGPALPKEGSVSLTDWMDYLDISATDITAWMENFVENIPAPEESAEPEDEPAAEDSGGALSLSKICGSYKLDNGMSCQVYEQDGGVIVEYVYNPEVGPMSYDKATGTAYTNAGGDEIKCVFTINGSTVRMDGTSAFYSDGRLVMTMDFGGVKTD